MKEQKVDSQLRRKLIHSAWATPVVVVVTLPQHAQASPATTTVAPCTVYQIGDTGPAGGLVFYTSNGGCSGLEAVSSDQGRAEWGCFGIDVSGASGTGIGDGAANTQAILSAGCNSGADAANLASNVGSGWFLPSRDELNAMYTQLYQNGLGGFANDIYWSSSQDGEDNAWLQSFINGDQDTVGKSFSSQVRAVRAF